MGAWRFVLEYLRELVKDDQMIRYVGRPESAAPLWVIQIFIKLFKIK